MKLKYYFLPFCFALLNNPFTGTSQNLRTARSSSHYTYIYKITNEQLFNCYKKPKFFYNLEKDLILAIDSFPSDSGCKDLSPGAYIMVRASDNYLEYELKCVNTFDVSTYSNKHDLMLLVYNRKTGAPLSTATVHSYYIYWGERPF